MRRAFIHSEEVGSTRRRVSPTLANPRDWTKPPPHKSCSTVTMPIPLPSRLCSSTPELPYLSFKMTDDGTGTSPPDQKSWVQRRVVLCDILDQEGGGGGGGVNYLEASTDQVQLNV